MYTKGGNKRNAAQVFKFLYKKVKLSNFGWNNPLTRVNHIISYAVQSHRYFFQFNNTFIYKHLKVNTASLQNNYTQRTCIHMHLQFIP